jgi:hypothetical protein
MAASDVTDYRDDTQINGQRKEITTQRGSLYSAPYTDATKNVQTNGKGWH